MTVRRRKVQDTSIALPSIAFIVARSSPGNVIGCDNRVPWTLKTDLRRFRSITTGHAVVMGRQTFDSIGHPLPNRFNIVLSTRAGESTDNLLWVTNREEAIFFADHYSIKFNKKEFFVVGGGQIYSLFSSLFNKIYLTEVFAPVPPRADSFFNEEFDRRKWRLVQEADVPASEIDEFPSRFVVLERRLKIVRQIELSEFMTKDAEATSRLATIEHA